MFTNLMMSRFANRAAGKFLENVRLVTVCFDWPSWASSDNF